MFESNILILVSIEKEWVEYNCVIRLHILFLGPKGFPATRPGERIVGPRGAPGIPGFSGIPGEPGFPGKYLIKFSL